MPGRPPDPEPRFHVRKGRREADPRGTSLEEEDVRVRQSPQDIARLLDRRAGSRCDVARPGACPPRTIPS